MSQAPQAASPSAPAPNRVLAATLDGATLVAVQGTGNFRLAPAFKQALAAAAAAGSATVLVDMADCTHVDSTFMGAIAAAALAARKAGPGGAQLHFLDIRSNVAQLLKGLGILALMRVAPGGTPGLAGLAENLAPVDAGPVSDRTMAALLYDAHETLAKMSPENQARFRDVLSFLRGDLERAGGRPEGGS